VSAQPFAVFDPVRLEFFIDEGAPDGKVGLVVCDPLEGGFSTVGNVEPLHLHRDGIQLAGLDILQSCGIDFCETFHHLREKEGAEPRVFPAGASANRFERKTICQFKNVHVVTGFRPRGKGESFICRHVEQMKSPTEDGILFDREKTKG